MTRKEFLGELEELLSRDANSLHGTELLSNVKGWDSLAIISFIGVVDEKLELTLNPKQIAACKTVDDLFALCGSKIAG